MRKSALKTGGSRRSNLFISFLKFSIHKLGSIINYLAKLNNVSKDTEEENDVILKRTLIFFSTSGP